VVSDDNVRSIIYIYITVCTMEYGVGPGHTLCNAFLLGFFNAFYSKASHTSLLDVSWLSSSSSQNTPQTIYYTDGTELSNFRGASASTNFLKTRGLIINILYIYPFLGRIIELINMRQKKKLIVKSCIEAVVFCLYIRSLPQRLSPARKRTWEEKWIAIEISIIL